MLWGGTTHPSHQEALMARPPATRTPFGRLLVQRVLELGWSVAAAAKALGVSRTTAERPAPAVRGGRDHPV